MLHFGRKLVSDGIQFSERRCGVANILLTERCVRACPYCFAKGQMNKLSGKDMISWEDFIHTVDLFEASREQQIRVAKKVQDEQGWNAWPTCSEKLGLQ